MGKKRVKLISFILAAAMIIQLFSLPAYAAGVEAPSRHTMSVSLSITAENGGTAKDDILISAEAVNRSGHDLSGCRLICFTDTGVSLSATENFDIPVADGEPFTGQYRMTNMPRTGIAAVLFKAFSVLFGYISRFMPMLTQTEYIYEGQRHTVTAFCAGTLFGRSGTARKTEFVLDGADAPAPIYTDDGVPAVLPGAPEISGAVFAGWSKDVPLAFGGDLYDETEPVTENFTLYGTYIVLKTDTDGDGLPDDAERLFGTSIYLTDTDEDGIDDMSELVIYGTDPNDPFDVNALPGLSASLVKLLFGGEEAE